MIKFASLSVADGYEVSTLFVGVELVDCAGGVDDQTAGVGADFDPIGIAPVDGVQVENCVVHCVPPYRNCVNLIFAVFIYII